MMSSVNSVPSSSYDSFRNFRHCFAIWLSCVELLPPPAALLSQGANLKPAGLDMDAMELWTCRSLTFLSLVSRIHRLHCVSQCIVQRL